MSLSCHGRGAVAVVVVAIGAMAQGLPPLPLAAADRAAVVAAGQDPDQLLRRLASTAPDEQRQARAAFDALAVPLRAALCRAGLRSEDPLVRCGAAVVAAGTPGWLDLDETRAAARAGRSRAVVTDTPFDFAAYCDLLDAAGATELLAGEWPLPREIFQPIGALHHRLGPEHVPLLVQLAGTDDVLLREDAFGWLPVALQHTTAHDDKVAAAVLAWPGRRPWQKPFDPTERREALQPRPFTLRPPGEGFPALLAAVLDRLFLQECDDDLAKFRPWAWRWSLRLAPAERDRELLVRLVASADERGQQAGIRGLLRLPAPEREPALQAARARAAVGADAGLAPWWAVAAHAADGDAAARQRLAASAGHPFVLAHWLQAEPAAARTAIFAQVLDADPAVGLGAIERLDDALAEARFWGIAVDGEAVQDALAAAAATAGLDGARLGLLLRRFDRARTAALCAQALAALRPELLGDIPLPVLELHDGHALLEWLRRTFADDALKPEHRDLVADALLRVGEQRSAGRLWAWAMTRTGDERVSAMLRFGACGGDEVEKLIAALVTAEPPPEPTPLTVAPLCAWLAVYAHDTRLAEELLRELCELPGDDFAAAWRALAGPLRAGQNGAAAVAAYMAIRPPGRGELRGLGAFGEAVRPWLQRVRAEREHGLYRWATGELALQGDPAARAELDAAFAARLYRWLDDADPEVLASRGSAEGVIRLLPLLESNCCTFAVVGSRLEDLFEADAFVAEDGLRTRPQLLQDRWWRVGERWRWSWLAGRLVAGSP